MRAIEGAAQGRRAAHTLPLVLSVILFGGLTARAAAGPLPDLVEAKVSIGAESRAPNETFKVRDTVRNKGDAKARRAKTRFYLSNDERRSRGDARIGRRKVAALRPGAADEGRKRLTVPLDTPSGNYFVVACADDLKTVVESREKNNCTASRTTLFVEPLDITAPPAPTITSLDPQSPSKQNDVAVRGDAEEGSTVEIFASEAACALGVDPLATGSAAQFFDPGIVVSVSDDTQSQLSARAIDDAGNVSACSPGFTYIEDSTPPQAPEIEGSRPSSTTPHNDNDPEVFGTAPADTTVMLFKSSDCSGPVAASGDAAVFDDPGITIHVDDNQTTTITARARDAAGNYSSCSASITYVEDSTPPDVPEITGSSPTYSAPQNDNDPEIFGIAPVDAVKIELFTTSDCSGAPVASGTPGEFQSEGIAIHVPSDATTTIAATATDAGGNETACSASITYVEDSTAPSAPEITGSTPSSGAPHDDNYPEVFGSAPPGTTVRLYTTPDCSGEPVASGSAAQFADPGITVHVDDDTATTLRATAGDEAGNESTCSAGLTYIEDSPTPFETEPNNDLANANRLSGMTPKIRASISPKEDRDVFSITVPPGGSVVAETFDTSGTNCSEIDTELQLIGADGTQLAFDDDDGIASCSKIDGTNQDANARDLDPGTYFLAVTSWQGQEPIGIYQLNVTISPAPLEQEPNDSLAAATPLGSRYTRGAIQPVGDKDFYSFSVPDGGRVTAETFDSSGSGCADRDPLIRLYSQNGTELASDDDSGIGACARIDGSGPDEGASRLAAGTYYLSVEDAGDNDTIKAYVLKLETASGSKREVEPNNSIVEADGRASDPDPTRLAGDSRISGSIDPAGDRDFFRVELTSASVARFETFDGSGRDCPAGRSTTLRVYGPDGTMSYSDTGSGIQGCAALVVPLPAGISYVSIEETGNDAPLSSYVLELDLLTDGGSETEPNDSREQATPTSGTSFTITGEHQTHSDIDFYAITIPSGGASLRAEVIEATGGERCESGGLDSLLTLYGPSGDFLVNDDNDGRSLCSQIDGTGSAPKDAAAHELAPGTYYLAVEACPSPSCQIGERGQFLYRLAVTLR